MGDRYNTNCSGNANANVNNNANADANANSKNRTIWYIDANKLYGYAMMQKLQKEGRIKQDQRNQC